MKQLHSYYLAKILMVLRIPSFKNCKIDKTASVGYDSSLSYVSIGRYSYTACRARFVDVEIGNYCSIGQNVAIGGNMHPMNMVSTSPVFLYGSNPLRKNLAAFRYASSVHTYIGNDVWIGDGAYIKAGMRIGDGAVIGAHAVVTHDVEPYTIVAGVPAKPIRKRFDENTIKKLLAIKWWEWPEEKITSYADAFDDPIALEKAIMRKI